MSVINWDKAPKSRAPTHLLMFVRSYHGYHQVHNMSACVILRACVFDVAMAMLDPADLGLSGPYPFWLPVSSPQLGTDWTAAGVDRRVAMSSDMLSGN